MNRSLLLLLLCIAATAQLVAGIPTSTRVTGFIENKGQWPSEVLFLQRSANMDAWITRDGMVLDQYMQEGDLRRGHVVRMRWENSHGQVTPELGQSISSVSYHAGRENAGLIAKSYDRLRFSSVFDGVSVIYYLDQTGRLRYDLDVAAGTSAANVAFNFEGDQGLVVGSGDVRLRTTMGDIVMTDLYAYVFGNRALSTPVSFQAKSNGVRIAVPERLLQEPLTVDPIVHGTYVGGTGDDVIHSVVYGNDGVYVGGSTTGISFPKDVGAYQKNVKGLIDGFVAFFSKNLKTVTNYTYFGGGATDNVVGIALDAAGKVCITGETESNDLPTTIGSVGQIYKSQIDGYVARFTADLSTLEMATYIGGNKDDKPKAIAVELASGAIYIAGSTTSNAQFPVTLAHQATFGGQEDCFLAKLAPGGGTFVFCTYFGKDGKESFTAIAVDPAGSPYVTGSTTSSTFETAPTPTKFASGRVPYDRTYNGGNTDAFLIKFFPDGTLSKKDDGTYSTFFGGSGDDEGRGVYIDAQGRAILVGVTTSKGLPAAGTLFTEKIGGVDIFMCLFTDDGRGLTACTYFGGPGDDYVQGIIPENSLNAGLMWGTTTSTEFPTSGAGVIEGRSGSTDGFLTVLNPYTLKFSTLIGGSASDTTVAVSFDGNGDIYFAVRGESTDLSTSDTSWMAQPAGDADGYVGKWAMGTMALVTPSGGEAWCTGVSKTIAWSAAGMLDTDHYTIDVSSDGGKNWTNIAKELTGLNYNWKPSSSLPTGTNYKVRVYTTRGHLVYSPAFAIGAPPKVTTDPKSVSVCEGDDVSLMVVAEGVNIRYQWRKSGANINGAIEPTYAITGVTPATAGSYDCVITGACTPAATSKAAIIAIAITTKITEQPKDVTISEGLSFALHCKSDGSDLKYAWYRNGMAIDGATASSYSVAQATGYDEGKYTCLVTGGCGTDTSVAANVQVLPMSVQEDIVVGSTTMRVLGPIPALEYVIVRLTTTRETTVASHLLTTSGALAHEHSFGVVGAGTTDLLVPVTSISSGVYALELLVDGQVLRTSVLVNK